MENGNLPSILEIVKKLELVLQNSLSREEVSEWAGSYVMDDKIIVTDQTAWKLLKSVFGIDIKDSPNEYLHTDNELRILIKKYKQELY